VNVISAPPAERVTIAKSPFIVGDRDRMGSTCSEFSCYVLLQVFGSGCAPMTSPEARGSREFVQAA